ncbi:hypothetical protein LCGC14_2778040 [marine sediment metagenome]|uniref:Uncharacterized protein n=1 Tax=marine sediment metagenome TaxID=412755 RepID=A0A0F8YU51_9ZZZZ
MHWLRVSAPGGSVSFNNPEDPIALAKSAIAFLASRSEGVNLENRVEP